MMSSQMEFHGIGQGLFFSAKTIINSNNAFCCIYDCGTLGKLDQKLLESEIDGLPDTIDFMVISHLHKDHISGLKYLLEKREVKEIYLPYFDAKTYKEAFLTYLIINGIKPEGEDGLFELFKEWYFVDISSQHYSNIVLDKIEILSGEMTLQTRMAWKFAFFNKTIDAIKYAEINTKIKELIGLESVEEYFKHHRKSAIKDFKEVFTTVLGKGTENLTSLLLLIQPDTGNQTLLTGDADFDSNLEDRINKHLKEKYVLQVPHHGGKTNWTHMSEAFWHDAKDFVLSYGISNKYHHPSTKCINDILKVSRSKDIHRVFQGISYSY